MAGSLERHEGVHQPVVGVHHLGLLVGENAAQLPHQTRIWSRWRERSLSVAEQPRQRLCAGADAVHPHAVLDGERRPIRPGLRHHRHLVAAADELTAEALHVLLGPPMTGGKRSVSIRTRIASEPIVTWRYSAARRHSRRGRLRRIGRWLATANQISPPAARSEVDPQWPSRWP